MQQRASLWRPWRLVVFLSLFFVLAAFCACEGCRNPGGPDGSTPRPGTDGTPAARLYLVSDLAGALEPCGCVKDQLGGMDHFGALVAAEKDKAKGAGVLAAGPLFFMDMELAADRRAQEIKKAETIGASLRSVGLIAFAPGRNDWAGGVETLKKITGASGGSLVAANLQAPDAAPVKWTVKDVGGVKLGIIGVAAPDKAKVALEGVTSSAPGDAVKTAVEALKKDGAQAIVVIAAVGRGEAKRIADANPELLAIVVGSTGGGGDANTEAPPAERIGDVLIAETGNHLQTVAVLDLYPREGAASGGLVKFADGTGIERTRKREELTKRIDELRARVATWEIDKSVDPKDIAARKADITRLEAEQAALDKAPPPASGSYYRYVMREIRDNLGAEEKVKAQILAYYKHVNEANKLEFAGRKPKPAPKGEPGYVGIDMCTTCHEEPRKVWDKTKHAHAYPTLSTQFKEYNLDCVSCHVTGYDRPGGSTVTHTEDLQNVQCEVCHGPGSLHAAKPKTVKVPVVKPGADVCLSCHHPPHVHVFDAKAKMSEILGPGHASK
ncbi:MAG TPA: multiheme c-type cytochrome [Labilithrix sp.]|nr:multiheme c-type cytochrome [Labilithrix sp.]